MSCKVVDSNVGVIQSQFILLLSARRHWNTLTRAHTQSFKQSHIYIYIYIYIDIDTHTETRTLTHAHTYTHIHTSVQCLYEQGVLPRVLCGTSIGALVAALVGCHTDTELPALWRDPSAINFDAFIRLGVYECVYVCVCVYNGCRRG